LISGALIELCDGSINFSLRWFWLFGGALLGDRFLCCCRRTFCRFHIWELLHQLAHDRRFYR
jgi:hypothetical protein